MFMDLTVCHPRARKYAAQAAQFDGAAASVAEQNKRRRQRYPAYAAEGLRAVVPFAIETFGRLGPAA